ncbi:MAG TPA: FAD-binding domain-containing protein [Solirubrobacterales bacterium]|nr:FAD-binding domain-containing protein [Solirubrobacterales bacterium]
MLNPVRQAERFDPEGEYVRRYLPELEPVRGKAIFRPWPAEGFDRLGYPGPLYDRRRVGA